MAGWEDIALTLGNPSYPQLSAPGGPLQDMNGWQKAMLGIGMLGSLFSNMGNMGVVGRRKGIGGILASIGPALAATQQQAVQAAGQMGRPAAQAAPPAAGGQNRTRAWMEANAERLGISPDEIAGMDPTELVQRFWQMKGGRSARPGRSVGRAGSVPRPHQPDHGNRITRSPRTFPESWFPWPDFDDGFFIRPRPRFDGLLPESPLLPEPPLLPPIESNPRHPWPELWPDMPRWRWPIDPPPYDDPDHLIPHFPEDWRLRPDDYAMPLPYVPRRWPGLLEVPLAETET